MLFPILFNYNLALRKQHSQLLVLKYIKYFSKLTQCGLIRIIIIQIPDINVIVDMKLLGKLDLIPTIQVEMKPL